MTGCAGFIGSNLVDSLISKGFKVTGIDNFNNYYDPKIKQGNLAKVKNNKNFKLYKEDILELPRLREIFEVERIDKIIHLAARTGVRPSIADPRVYALVNVVSTVNLLKLSVDFGIKQFIFGSSSSVYGNSRKIPFTENDLCDSIISPYGASKRAAEFWVESFWRIYGLKSIILRFFTVYGQRGRPDMAPALFTKAILNSQGIKQFGDGSSSRDYTYIDDVVDGIVKSLETDLDFEIINLGNNRPVTLSKFIETLEQVSKKKAGIKKLQKQAGDVEKTWANVVKAKELLGWVPKTWLFDGLNKYYKWLKRNF